MKYRTRVVTFIFCCGLIVPFTLSSSIHPRVVFADRRAAYRSELQQKQRPSAKPSIVTLVSGVTHPDQVAVDKTRVYFVINGNKLAVRFKSGGSPTTLFETLGADEIRAVATDETGVYVLTSNKLVKVDPETHDSSELAQIESNDRQLMLDDTSAYWIGRMPGGKGNQLIKIDKKGGSLTPLATEIFAPQPGGLAVDQSTAYWLDYAVDTLKSVSKDGGSTTTLIKFSGPQAIAADDKYIYYSDVSGIIRKLDKKGGQPQTVVPRTQGSVFSIIADEDQLYFSGGRQIMKVSKNGGPPMIVVRNQGGSYRFAVDDCCVYWTAYETGRVMKGPK